KIMTDVVLLNSPNIPGRVARMFYLLNDNAKTAVYLIRALELKSEKELLNALKKDLKNKDLQKYCLTKFFEASENKELTDMLTSINPTQIKEFKDEYEKDLWSIKAWIHDWTEAFKQAKEKKGFVFVDFTASWCGPCKYLKKTVFIDEKFKEFIESNNWTLLMIDEALHRDLISKYKIQAFPTVAVFNENEEEIDRLVGAYGTDRFMQFFQLCLDNDNTFYILKKDFEAGDQDEITVARLMMKYHERGDKENFEKLMAIVKEKYPENPELKVYNAIKNFKEDRENSLKVIEEKMYLLDADLELFDQAINYYFYDLKKKKDWKKMRESLDSFENDQGTETLLDYYYQVLCATGDVDLLLEKKDVFIEYSTPEFFQWLEKIKSEKNKKNLLIGISEFQNNAYNFGLEIHRGTGVFQPGKETEFIDTVSGEKCLMQDKDGADYVFCPKPINYKLKSIKFNLNTMQLEIK
ncbi:MAG: thioredoxin family protein, partial [bacterium]|nr:thioredoxin family protein [bacterium]